MTTNNKAIVIHKTPKTLIKGNIYKVLLYKTGNHLKMDSYYPVSSTSLRYNIPKYANIEMFSSFGHDGKEDIFQLLDCQALEPELDEVSYKLKILILRSSVGDNVDFRRPGDIIWLRVTYEFKPDSATVSEMYFEEV